MLMRGKAGEEEEPETGTGDQHHGGGERERGDPYELAVAEAVRGDAGEEVTEDAADGAGGEDEADGGQGQADGHILIGDEGHHGRDEDGCGADE